jgi:hypothetical protein
LQENFEPTKASLETTEISSKGINPVESHRKTQKPVENSSETPMPVEYSLQNTNTNQKLAGNINAALILIGKHQRWLKTH